MIETLTWVLPRPRTTSGHKYKGGFPRFFEYKLLKLYKMPKRVLHPFGGKAEWGIAQDIKPEVYPDIIADAHYLPYKDNTFDFVIFDPPYSDNECINMYGTPPIKLLKCVKESVRVTKIGGHIALYHRLWIPRPEHTRYDMRIFVSPGQWHETRICHIFQKYE